MNLRLVCFAALSRALCGSGAALLFLPSGSPDGQHRQQVKLHLSRFEDELIIFSTSESFETYSEFSLRHNISWNRRFVMLLKKVSFAHQGCIYLTKNTVKTVML